MVVGGGDQRYAVDFERAIYAFSAALFSSCADDVLAILCLNAMHRQAVCEGPHSNSVGFLLHNTTACVTTIAGTIKPFRRVPYLNLGHNTPLSAIYSLFVVPPLLLLLLCPSVCSKAIAHRISALTNTSLG